MKLLTIAQSEKMLSNGSEENRDNDQIPVVKFFLPGTNSTWLLTQLDPESPNIAFGLCDLGMGFPELGCVDLEELFTVKSRFGLRVERDLYFKAKFPISVYARAASSAEYIVEDESVLLKFSKK